MMAAFGLGTLPNLLLAGLFVGRLDGFLKRPAVRAAAGLLIVAFGLWGLFAAVRLAIGQA
jgi:sulfite exporter TauE/SafE